MAVNIDRVPPFFSAFELAKHISMSRNGRLLRGKQEVQLCFMF